MKTCTPTALIDSKPLDLAAVTFCTAPKRMKTKQRSVPIPKGHKSAILIRNTISSPLGTLRDTLLVLLEAPG